MKIKVPILVLFLLCSACRDKTEKQANSVKKELSSEMLFDQEKWRVYEGKNYLFRDKMLNDLVYNVKLKTLKKGELITLLGPPDRTDSLYLFYTINQPRLLYFTMSLKSLVFKLTKDSTVEWRKIHE